MPSRKSSPAHAVVAPDVAPLWLVRHAQPLVVSGVCYGALDVAADPQATQDAAQALARHLPWRAQIITSPLQRCEQLTQLLRALRPDLTQKKDARLAEMDFGCWEGQRWDNIPQAAYDAWTADFWHHRFGGAECVADLMARVAQAWAEAQGLAAAGDVPVWVTHAGVIRAAGLLAQGVQEVHDAALWPPGAPGFGQWCCVNRSPASGGSA